MRPWKDRQGLRNACDLLMGSTGFSATAGKPTLIEGLRDVNAMFATCTMWRSGVVSNIWEIPGSFQPRTGALNGWFYNVLNIQAANNWSYCKGICIYICTHIYVENQVSAGWLSQLNLSNWKCENMCHHRATDQLGPPHGQAGKAFTPKFHTPSWLLAPLSWGAGKTASNRRGHVTFLNSVSKRRTDLEEHDNLHHTKKKQPSGRF